MLGHLRRQADLKECVQRGWLGASFWPSEMGSNQRCINLCFLWERLQMTGGDSGGAQNVRRGDPASGNREVARRGSNLGKST